MTRLPGDPLAPASRSQVRVAGVASAIAGVAFFVFAALTVRAAAAAGRLGQPPVILLVACMLVIGVGFLAVAVRVFRRQEKTDSQLLGAATLYLVGGFLVVTPLAIAAVMLLTHSYQDLWLLLKVLPISGLGLLALRLAHVRRKKRAPTP